jgi:hypothetical protein
MSGVGAHKHMHKSTDPLTWSSRARIFANSSRRSHNCASKLAVDLAFAVSAATTAAALLSAAAEASCKRTWLKRAKDRH